jgi:hypothetical protein
MTFASENKLASTYDYPTLRLEYQERARIAAIESEPEVEYVHTLKAPQLVDGRVEYEEIRQKSGDMIRQPKLDFIGRHICLGSFDILAQSGKDTKSCPVCAEAEKSSIVDPAQRRFAMHVIRYQLKPGSFDVADPFGVMVVAWCFTDGVFNKITDLASDFKLAETDLKLGPCENQKFQKFSIQPANGAEWTKSDQRKQTTVDTYRSNKCPDLSRLIGRRLTLEQVEQDLDKVRQANREAFGTREPDPDPFVVPEVVKETRSEPLASLPDPETSRPSTRTDELNFNDLLAGL